MQLFHSDCYTESCVGDHHGIFTPLGVLAPNVNINSNAYNINECDHVHIHKEMNAVILQWIRADCVVEALLVPDYREPSLTVDSKVVVIRVLALSADVLARISLSWLPGYCWRTFDPCQSGERLEACTWENADWKVTVGTEDNEALGGRSYLGKYMPRRLSYVLYNMKSNVALFSRQGVEINLPLLHTDELVQVHFEVTASQNRGEEDIDTWLSVGFSPNSAIADAGCT